MKRDTRDIVILLEAGTRELMATRLREVLDWIEDSLKAEALLEQSDEAVFAYDNGDARFECRVSKVVVDTPEESLDSAFKKKRDAMFGAVTPLQVKGGQ